MVKEILERERLLGIMAINGGNFIEFFVGIFNGERDDFWKQ